MLKYYTDTSIINNNQYDYWNPILWLKENEFNAEIKSKFWARNTLYKQVSQIKDADICFLPMAFNFYIKYRCLKKANDFIYYCNRYNKKVVVWIFGDYDYRIHYTNIILIHQGPCLNQLGVFRLTANAELRNELASIDDFLPRSKSVIPKVGFVGQVYSNRVILYFFRNILWNIIYRLRITNWVPPGVIPHVYLRRKVLKILKSDNRVEASFIYRNKFMGSNASEYHKNEYFQNMLSNDYIVCIRGSGNFSFRLFEAISNGKIPIIIDTNITLPFNDLINWDKICIKVAEKDISSLPDLLIEFHSSITNEDFKRLQFKIKKIWHSYFEVESFYFVLSDYLLKLK